MTRLLLTAAVLAFAAPAHAQPPPERQARPAHWHWICPQSPLPPHRTIVGIRCVRYVWP